MAKAVKKRFNKEKFIEDVKANVRKMYRLDIEDATQQQIFQAVGDVVEDEVIGQWMDSCQKFLENRNQHIFRGF